MGMRGWESLHFPFLRGASVSPVGETGGVFFPHPGGDIHCPSLIDTLLKGLL